MMSPLDITIFALCLIAYIILISYCAYRCRGEKEENSTEYVEV